MGAFKKNENDDAAFESFMENLVQARTSGRWMAAVWEIRDGRITLKGWTTSSFERGDYLRAVSQFASVCAEEGLSEAPVAESPIDLPAPLPRAVPNVKVFSMDEPEDEKGEPEKEATVGATIEDAEPVSIGFPAPTPPTTQKMLDEKMRELPQVNVQRCETAVIVHAEGELPLALPPDVSEAQITEAVETYRAGMGATQ